MNCLNTNVHSLEDQTLPMGKLLVFTMTGFITIMTETMPAGLLYQISADLSISEALAGQLITLYALGSVVAAIPIISITQSWNRRPLLLIAIAGLLVFNIITAVSNSFMLILAARFCAGMSAGVIWGLLAGYARRLVTFSLQGRALAIAGVGQPIALAFGVPLGTWLGTFLDWRSVFWIMSVISLFLLIWIRLFIPDFVGQSIKERLSIRDIFLLPGIRSVLLALFAWVLAHNILYTYISVYLALMGLGNRVDVILLLFGITSIGGIWLTGIFVDRFLRNLTILSLALFFLASLLFSLAGNSIFAILTAISLWGITFGGAPILLQTALADNARGATDLAQSILVTVFNLAVAGGGLIGGLLIDFKGGVSLSWAVMILIPIALSVVWMAKNHGFKLGTRANNWTSDIVR